ncbi:hypothetical protein BACCAP_02773 [Pseudoflavonifractor capillosus ATCC 29799]|uniref:Uncharacterized protein n=1 Tax=Pseudoflavonifractor capillosus ATCC 29799 TaxID=411467 RepID=A6NX29_9FIRM|nr:hypothetical protein BACCAP_02773 [Pseudoflavonifractor capillosus ATCC 29799]
MGRCRRHGRSSSLFLRAGEKGDKKTSVERTEATTIKPYRAYSGTA